MNVQQEIESTLKEYLSAFYTQDFDKMYELLYEDDVIEHTSTIIDFAEKMDVFGETEDFLKKLRIKSLQDLKRMSPKDVMKSIFGLVTQAVGSQEIKEMIEQTQVTEISEAEYICNVSYEYPLRQFDELMMYQGQVQMIKTAQGWKLFYTSGLEAGLKRFQNEIDRYYERKQFDNPSNFEHEGDLTPFTVTGYRNLSGEIVFEPRFKDAGDFSEGLAYVQIMRKYGYIDTQGEIVIKPSFLKAHSFSQKLASVLVEVDGVGKRWGFIDTSGEFIIKPKYTDAQIFSEGLCAVEFEGKWGYIDKKGTVKIPYQFDSASDFDDGTAYVEVYDSEDEAVEYIIDAKGKIIE